MGLKSYELGGLLAFWSVFFTLLSYITFDPTGASCAPTRVRARHVLAPTARTRLRQGARSVTPTGTGRMSSHHSRSHRTPARITPARITAAPTSRARSPHVCRSHVVLLSLSPPPPPPPPPPPLLQNLPWRWDSPVGSCGSASRCRSFAASALSWADSMAPSSTAPPSQSTCPGSSVESVAGERAAAASL